MKFLMTLTPLLLLTSLANAQTNQVMPLWPDGAPGALGNADKDIPTLTVFLPAAEKATGAALVVCPGGGYTHLSEHEGKDYALWLNQSGIAAFVLKYRLGTSGYHHPAMLQDATRALRTVRANATAWKLDPKRIGIMGSSAGGHLASTLLTHYDAGNPDATDPIERESSRPDIGILCYAVITMGEKTHKGSHDALLGRDPSPELIKLLSNELQVTKDTPPCFIWATANDRTVPVENSLEFAAALHRAGVPVDLHIYENGPHGIGLGIPHATFETIKFHPWTADCLYWLKERGFVK